MDTYNLLKTAMDVSQTRSELISNNIANVNTPNYKAKRVVFESQLSQAMDNLNLTETHKNHMQTGERAALTSHPAILDFKRTETTLTLIPKW